MAPDLPVGAAADPHLFDLTLAILGVIQGLAFGHVAEKLPRITARYSRVEHALIFSVYAVCLLIVVRVFQTYALAAIDHVMPDKLQFSDLLGMFGVGLLEYWIFDAIGKYRANFKAIFNRVGVLYQILWTLTRGRFPNRSVSDSILFREDPDDVGSGFTGGL